MINAKEVFSKIDKLFIEHDAYVETRETLLNGIAHGVTGQVMVVAGPTGVGKTKLLRDIDSQFIRKWKSENKNMGSPPLVIEARAPKQGSFNWRHFFHDAFSGLNELYPGRKRYFKRSSDERTFKQGPIRLKKPTIDELHEMLIEGIRIKKPSVMLIDEAQLLGRVRTRTRLGENLDVIKGLANETGINIIMFGTSESRDMLYANAQLSRRVTVVHFRRYQKTQYGMEKYLSALASVIKAMSLPVHESVYQDPYYLYDHSLGCVGVLMDWLKRSIGYQVSNGDSLLRLKHFKKKRLSDLALKTMLKEALAFEAQQSNSPYFDYDECVQNDLFVTRLEFGDPLTTPVKRRTKNIYKPGKRLPTRDPIGASSDEVGQK